MMQRSDDTQYNGASLETALLVDNLLYATPSGRRKRAEKEAVIIALEYRDTRLVPEDDLFFRQQALELGVDGPDLIESFVRVIIACDPDLYWLEDDEDEIAGVVAAIQLLARQVLWINPNYDEMLRFVSNQQYWGKRGLDACRSIYQGLRAA